MQLDSKWFSMWILSCSAVCAVLTPFAAAEQANFEPIANRLAADIRKTGTESVAVTDFLTSDGKHFDLGWYVASKLSDALLREAHEFRVLDRAELANPKVTAEEVGSLEALKRIGGVWGVAAIVTGTVEISSQQYLILATLRRSTDGVAIASLSQGIPHARVLDLLSPGGLNAEAAPPQQPGMNGVNVPGCAYCPSPQYSEKARKAGITSARVILSVTISTSGNAVKIGVTKDAGYGFTEKAIEDVSDWKFRPAAGKDGTPVPVAVPVELTFSSSRT